LFSAEFIYLGVSSGFMTLALNHTTFFIKSYIGNVILFLKKAYTSQLAFLLANDASNKSLSENHLLLNILRSS
jgi:hypothetical protein